MCPVAQLSKPEHDLLSPRQTLIQSMRAARAAHVASGVALKESGQAHAHYVHLGVATDQSRDACHRDSAVYPAAGRVVVVLAVLAAPGRYSVHPPSRSGFRPSLPSRSGYYPDCRDPYR